MITLAPEPLDGLPSKVTIYEVGPRDGLQNEAHPVSADTKVELIGRLADAGLGVIEVTSFVPAKWIPQLADSGEVYDAVRDLRGVRLPVLVPNERGLHDALEHGVREVAIFASATETFARKNLNRTIAESFAMFKPVVDQAKLPDALPPKDESAQPEDPPSSDTPQHPKGDAKGLASGWKAHYWEPLAKVLA